MYKHELLKRISALEKKIQGRDEQISMLIAKNNAEKLRLSKMRLSLESKLSDEALQQAKARPKSPKMA